MNDCMIWTSQYQSLWNDKEIQSNVCFMLELNYMEKIQDVESCHKGPKQDWNQNEENHT